ncbi:MAG: FHA domain-containing protein [Anaerolineae bacterium]|nr:FHA domain-containing protein [Anaerolineae bacterium]
MAHTGPEPIAKVIWENPSTDAVLEYLLLEGATATIGRSRSNDICVPERHVSRRHAVIRFRDGGFLIADLGSANGTFVNDQPVNEPYLLLAGDVIRLFVPVLRFEAYVAAAPQAANTSSMIITPTRAGDNPYLVVTAGAQEGAEFRLLKPRMRIGRSVPNADWEICLEDRAVSRPHCQFQRLEDGAWQVTDLRSANGTRVNGASLPPESPQALHDGDLLAIGATRLLFRVG